MHIYYIRQRENLFRILVNQTEFGGYYTFTIDMLQNIIPFGAR